MTDSGVATPPSFASSLLAGGAAGWCVDMALFPIDTIKTRLQAPGGFWKAGGFKGIYQGLGAVALGSAPGAALFFSTYEQTKKVLLQRQQSSSQMSDTTIHMTAASAGEFTACLVRVPTEVVKARMQTTSSGAGNMMQTIRAILQEPLSASSTQPAGLSGLYRGFSITLLREIPFSMIQFPLVSLSYAPSSMCRRSCLLSSHLLPSFMTRPPNNQSTTHQSNPSIIIISSSSVLKYEQGKIWCSDTLFEGHGCSPLAAAACGSVSGAIAGALTTPLDVLKTRHMLGTDGEYRYKGLADVFQRTLQKEGPRAFLHGLSPRVFWISLGGFVFFGAYETRYVGK